MSNDFFKNLAERMAKSLLTHFIEKVVIDGKVTKEEAKEVLDLINKKSEEEDSLKVFNKIGS